MVTLFYTVPKGRGFIFCFRWALVRHAFAAAPGRGEMLWQIGKTRTKGEKKGKEKEAKWCSERTPQKHPPPKPLTPLPLRKGEGE
jgi:hypothetical protein